MNPLVSVLMTAYNREDYIAKALESVLSSDLKISWGSGCRLNSLGSENL